MESKVLRYLGKKNSDSKIISTHADLEPGNTLGFNHVSGKMDSPSTRYLGCGHQCPFDPTIRTKLTDTYIGIYAWPSLGGVIILDGAEAIDFEFLGLDPFDPPLHRPQIVSPKDSVAAADSATARIAQDEEDAFCRRLLLLGAKWWDSEFRYSVISHWEGRANGSGWGDRMFGYIDIKPEPGPTMREKRFVKVGWPSSSSGGGLWVSDFETTFGGVEDEDDLMPYDENEARLMLARTMDERCAMLRDRFRGKFYESVERYEGGHTFLRGWEEKAKQKKDGREKVEGEVGPLLTPDETVDKWRQSL